MATKTSNNTELQPETHLIVSVSPDFLQLFSGGSATVGLIQSLLREKLGIVMDIARSMELSVKHSSIDTNVIEFEGSAQTIAQCAERVGAITDGTTEKLFHVSTY